MIVALGEAYSGVFSVGLMDWSFFLDSRCFKQTSDELWQNLQEAGEVEYDRLWRMPLDEDYGPQIYSSNADLQNVSSTK
jgi:aminopeptidase